MTDSAHSTVKKVKKDPREEVKRAQNPLRLLQAVGALGATNVLFVEQLGRLPGVCKI